MFLQPLGQFEQRRRALEHAFADVFGRRVKASAQEFGEIAVERAHRRADAHVVVVEDDQQVAVRHAGVVQCLKRHAGRHGSVTNHRNGVALDALDARGLGHTQCGRNRRTGMRGAKGVEFALATLRKTAQSAKLAQGRHAVAPPGKDFVRVGLVAHIPHDAVMRGVVNVVQGHRELDRSQVGTEVTTGSGDAIEQKTAQLVSEFAQLVTRHQSQVCRIIDRVQQWVLIFRHMLFFS
jgi:GMP synthase-like glutamine amidotransferase